MFQTLYYITMSMRMEPVHFKRHGGKIPLFARIIHLADMIDIIGNSKDFNGQRWNFICQYLSKNKDRHCRIYLFRTNHNALTCHLHNLILRSFILAIGSFRIMLLSLRKRCLPIHFHTLLDINILYTDAEASASNCCHTNTCDHQHCQNLRNLFVHGEPPFSQIRLE